MIASASEPKVQHVRKKVLTAVDYNMDERPRLDEADPGTGNN